MSDEDLNPETFCEGDCAVDTTYTSAEGMRLVAVRNATPTSFRLVVAALRDVWPLKVPKSLAHHFSGYAPETYVTI